MKHIIGIFFITTTFLSGMHNQHPVMTKDLIRYMCSLPSEMRSLIFEFAKKNKFSTYPFNQKEQNYSQLCLPATIPINMVQFDYIVDGVPIVTDITDNFLPHIVISVNKDTHNIFCETLMSNNNFKSFSIGNNAEDPVVFDGFNDNNKGIIFVYHKQSNLFSSYCLYKSRKMHIKSDWASLCQSEHPISCVLDKKKDTFLLLTKDQDQHSINMCRINAQDHSFRSLTKLTVPYSVLKVASFGNNIYGLLTGDGHFKTVVYNADHNQLLVKNQHHGSTQFKHIAINPDYINKRNFRPRFALLTIPDDRNNAKLFVCDLRKFEEPTLLLAHVIPDAHRVSYFYYKSSTLRLIYHNEEDPMRISCSTILFDNFDLLFTKALINRNTHLLRKRSKNNTSEDEPQSKRRCFEQQNIKKNNT